jgi:hypothetical protein
VLVPILLPELWACRACPRAGARALLTRATGTDRGEEAAMTLTGILIVLAIVALLVFIVRRI